MNENRKLVLDTETTGLNVENGDRIIEIGIIELIDKIKQETIIKYILILREN